VKRGKLYRFSGEFVANVNYRLLGQASTHLWGELIPTEYGRIGDGESYTIELEDNHKIKCNLRKRVNGAVTGMPPRYIYHFVGTVLLE
jgi:hypothetical protein